MLYNGKPIYEESPTAADPQRLSYHRGILDFIEAQNAPMKLLRASSMPADGFPESIEEHRRAYCDLIGLSVLKNDSPPVMHKEYLGEDAFSDIYRVTVTLFGRIPFYGLLFLPKNRGSDPLPLVIAQHGGGGTPGLCAAMHGENNYQFMVQRALERSAAVFAPQLLLWNMGTASPTCPTHTVPYDRTVIDVQLKRLGTSLLALEIFGISSAMTALSELPRIDGARIGIMGLSYGGFYTLYTMAADPRIKAGFSSAVFNDRDVYAWEDMTFMGSAKRFQDAEVAALCAPRPLFLSVGRRDDVFDYRPSPAEAARILPYYAAFGAEDALRYELWDGGHTVNVAGDGLDFFYHALGLPERRLS